MFDRKQIFGKIVLCMAALLLTCGGTLLANGAQEPSSVPDQATVSTVDIEKTGGLFMPLSSEGTTFSWMLREHPTYPESNDWIVWSELEKITGISIDRIWIPDSNYQDKKAVILASRDIPDFMPVQLEDANLVADDGLFLDLTTYFEAGDKVPNVLSVTERLGIQKSIVDSKGRYFGFPWVDSGKTSQAWLVRKDILDKEGLAVPTTMEEFFDVALTLKEKYPDVTPVTVRNYKEGRIGGLMDTAFDTFLNTKSHQLVGITDGKAVFGPALPQSRELVDTLRRMYSEGIIDADYPLVSTKMWQERILVGKAFFTMDWNTRSEYYNNRAQIEGFNFERMLPPIPAGRSGKLQPKSPIRGSANPEITVISADLKKPDIAVQFLDFLYSPMGNELMVWGIEGVTFERMANGGRKYTDMIETAYSKGENPVNKGSLGLSYNFICLNATRAPNDMDNPPWDAWVKTVEENGRRGTVLPVLIGNSEETERWTEIYPNVEEHFAENLDLFVMGKRDMSEWDDLIQELAKLGSGELVEIRQAQYDRVFN